MRQAAAGSRRFALRQSASLPNHGKSIVGQIGLALNDFEPLRPAEVALLEACRHGGMAAISARRPGERRDENTVRADFLRFLIMGGDHRAHVHAKGVVIKGAWITGGLDLEDTVTACGFECIACRFDEHVILRGSKISGSISFKGSWLRGIRGDRVVVHGSMFLRDGFRSDGAIRLLNAKIEGNLNCDGARIAPRNRENPYEKEAASFNAKWAVITGNVRLCREFNASGGVLMTGCRIGGDLNCQQSRLTHRNADAFNADRAVVRGNLFFDEGSRIVGTVSLVGARIGGNLDFNQCRIYRRTGISIFATNTTIKGDAYFGDGFRTLGEVALSGARIMGNLDCSGGTFLHRRLHARPDSPQVVLEGPYDPMSLVPDDDLPEDPGAPTDPVALEGETSSDVIVGFDEDGTALFADGVFIKGDAFLRDGFRTSGTVRLIGAQIGGDLDCSDARFDNGGGDSLMAERAYIRGNVFFRKDFFSIGELKLIGTVVRGSLECEDAIFVLDRKSLPKSSMGPPPSGDDDDAIESAAPERSTTTGGRRPLNRMKRWLADIRMIGSAFTRKAADIHNKKMITAAAGNDGRWAFNGSGMHVHGEFFFRTNMPTSHVNLESATVLRLKDRFESWGEMLNLDGFSYRSLEVGAAFKSRQRIAWIDLQADSMCCAKRRSKRIAKRLAEWIASRNARLRTVLSAWRRGRKPPRNPLLDFGIDFRPQPWRQLQKIMLDMGHTEESREVAIRYEERLRHAHRIGIPPETWPTFMGYLYKKAARFSHWWFGLLAGYGYRPALLLAWFLIAWIGYSVIYWYMALEKNVFAPSDPLVFQHEAYTGCHDNASGGPAGNQITLNGRGFVVVMPPGEMPVVHTQNERSATVPKIATASAHGRASAAADADAKIRNWYLCEDLRMEYSGFSPLAYSLDVMLPLVDLQQEKSWAPMIKTPKAIWYRELLSMDAEHITRLLVWAQTLFGWIVSLLFVAIVSGMAKRREE